MPPVDEPSFGRRWRAPRGDRAFLADPQLADAPGLVARNRAAQSEESDQRIPWSTLAAEARSEFVAAARNYSAQYLDPAPQPLDGPLILAGHQPGMFHPGVWCKNFLIDGLAKSLGGAAINFVVNTDTLRQAALRVPSGEPTAPHWESIPFDEAADEMPFEERRILDRGMFDAFGERARNAMKRLVPRSLLETYWPRAIERANASGNLGKALSESRHQVEREWGLSTWEIPWSDALELPSVLRLTAMLLADSCRLREHYNEAILAYRRAYRVRSRNHPAPLLELNGDWCEAPFRVWRADDPRRKRLFVRKRGCELQLSDRAEWSYTMPAACPGGEGNAIDALAGLAAQGIKLRTRALATTLYARVLLADLFVHGIGGGLYDQVTDRWMHRAWGLTPPSYLVATATLYLPMNVAQGANGTPSLRSALRELAFHPERFLDGEQLPPEAREAIASKERWIATEQTRENARERCRAIRQANETLQAWVEPARDRAVVGRELEQVRQQTEQVARWREYGFPLYPERDLRDFLLEIPQRTV
jgi:hypothetical protein